MPERRRIGEVGRSVPDEGMHLDLFGQAGVMIRDGSKQGTKNPEMTLS